MPRMRLGATVSQHHQRPRRSRSEHDDRHDSQRRGYASAVRHARSDQAAARAGEVQFGARIAGSAGRTTARRSRICMPRAAEDRTRGEAFRIDAGERAILLGTDTGADPAKYLLRALAACVTTSIICVAAARKVQLNAVESTPSGDMDMRGALGVDDEPRNGFERSGVSSAWRGTRAGEAPRCRRASHEAVGRLRHGHQRRARHRRGERPLILGCGSRSERCSRHGPDERIGDSSMPIELAAHTETGAPPRRSLRAARRAVRRRQVAVAADEERRAHGFASSLEQIARRSSCLPQQSASAARTSRDRAHSEPAPSRAGGSTAARCSARCRPRPPIPTSQSPMPHLDRRHELVRDRTHQRQRPAARTVVAVEHLCKHHVPHRRAATRIGRGDDAASLIERNALCRRRA
jgi:hypothetical protein